MTTQVGSAPEGERRLGRYALRYKIAQGGMASIYLAELAGTQGFRKWVAIKVMHDHLAGDDGFVSMFLDEARLASQIQHPNVCQVIDFGEEDGSYFIVMEYLHGETLSSVVKHCIGTHGEVPTGLVAAVIADIARGLHAAHELRGPNGELLDVVHRDVSPQNMLVLYDGMAKITDFGVARSRSRITQTQTGMIKGKFAYMSPEQLNGQPVDRRSDIWGLGVVLWEATTGKRLFRARSEGETALRIVQGDIPRPSVMRPGYPPGLEEVVMQALVRDPGGRFATAGELGGALETYLRGTPEVWGPSQVGGFVAELLRERREQRDAMLAANVAGPAIEVDLESVSTFGSKVVPRSAGGPTVGASDDAEELATIIDPQTYGAEVSGELDRATVPSEPATPLDDLTTNEVAVGRVELMEEELPTREFAPEPPTDVHPPNLADPKPPRARIRWPLAAAIAGLVVAGGVGAGLAYLTLGEEEVVRLEGGDPTPAPEAVTPPSSAQTRGAAEPVDDEPSAPSPAIAAPAPEETAPDEADGPTGPEEETATADPGATPEVADEGAETGADEPDEGGSEEESDAPAPPPAQTERAEPRPRPAVARTPAPTGRLNLMAIPRAEVRMGRRLLGTTPLVNASLPAGRHVLRLRAVDGSASGSVVVTIRPDQRTVESVRLR